MSRASSLLVGVGNVLWHDDGAGVYAALHAARLGLGRRLDVWEAGACGFDAAGELEGRRRVVLVDAIDAGLTPGTVVVLRPEELQPATRSGVSLHDAHVLDALAETRLLRRAPRRVRFVAVQVADVSVGLGLSPALVAALPRLVREALRELGIRSVAVPAWAEYGEPCRTEARDRERSATQGRRAQSASQAMLELCTTTPTAGWGSPQDEEGAPWN